MECWMNFSVRFPFALCLIVTLITPHTESPAGHLSVGSWQNEQKWCDWQDLSGLWCHRKPAASLGGYAVQPTQTCGSMAHVALRWTGGHDAGLETRSKDPIHKQKLLRNPYQRDKLFPFLYARYSQTIWTNTKTFFFIHFWRFLWFYWNI